MYPSTYTIRIAQTNSALKGLLMFNTNGGQRKHMDKGNEGSCGKSAVAHTVTSHSFLNLPYTALHSGLHFGTHPWIDLLSSAIDHC